MDGLEERDRRDRVDGTPRSERLRAVHPEVGRFLFSLVIACGARTIFEGAPPAATRPSGSRVLPAAVESLRPGGLLVADNLVFHAEALEGFRESALGHPELTGLVVPVGRGEVVAVKIDSRP